MPQNLLETGDCDGPCERKYVETQPTLTHIDQFRSLLIQENCTRDVTATSWGPDRFDIWALGSDRDLQHKYFQTDRYSEWEGLGGSRLIGKPAVASQRLGSFDIVVSRNAGASARQYLSKSFDGSRWEPDVSGFHNQTGTFAGAAAVVSWSNTTVAYFGVTPEDKLVFRTWWGGGFFPDDGSWFELADLAKGEAVASEPQLEL